jgi:flagella basal body P-ring formation protein FlgA
MKRILILCVAARAFAACHLVEGDHILGMDFIAANPMFAGFDPNLALSSAPVPGVRRVFHQAEIVRIAHANDLHLSGPVEELCFELATKTLVKEDFLPVLGAALNIDDAEIEVLDFTHSGMPRGALEFARAGLSPSGLWRGRVSYFENRSAPVWVKVRITTQQIWVEAGEPLGAGEPIDAAQLVIRRAARFPFGRTPLVSIGQAAGQLAARSIKGGEAIFASMLVAPREVQRGDTVAVEVLSGEARLSFDARAESSGRLGESVMIRNPGNGKSFQARVEGKDKVCVRK